jgi:hypothetical protein
MSSAASLQTSPHSISFQEGLGKREEDEQQHPASLARSSKGMLVDPEPLVQGPLRGASLVCLFVFVFTRRVMLFLTPAKFKRALRPVTLDFRVQREATPTESQAES